MQTKKVRIETILDDGTKFVVSIHGPPSREKISKFFDLIELMGAEFSHNLQNELDFDQMTHIERLAYIIRKNLFGRQFTINDVAEELEKEFGYSMKRSTLATYLSRLVDQNRLDRRGIRGRYRYSMNMKNIVSQAQTLE